MADVEINDLTLDGLPNLSDEIEIQKTGGGGSFKQTLQQVKDLVAQIADGTAEGQTLRWNNTLGEYEVTTVLIDASGNLSVIGNISASGEGGFGALVITSASPRLDFRDNDAVDKNISLTNDGGTFNFQLRDDLGTLLDTFAQYLESTGVWDFKNKDIVTIGDVTANTYFGDGSNLTGISGTVPDGTADGQTLRWEADTSAWQASGTLLIDDSQNATFAGDITANGNLTTLGIDDNATQEVFDLGPTDNVATWGVSGIAWNHIRSGNDQYVYYGGGDNAARGAGWQLFGGAHPTLANDAFLNVDGVTKLHFDASSNVFNYQGTSVTGINDLTVSPSTGNTGLLLNSPSAANVGVFWQDNGTNEWTLYRIDSTNVLTLTEDGVGNVMEFSPNGAINLIRSGSVNTPLAFDPDSNTEVNNGSLYALRVGALSGTPGQDNYSGGVVFNKIASTRRGGAIAGKQTSTDPDQMGLAFFVHGSSNTTHVLQERMVLDHNGELSLDGVFKPNRAVIGDGVDENSGYQLQVTSTGGAVHKLQGGASSTNYLAFGTASDALNTNIQVTNGVGELVFWTNGNNRARVTDAGMVIRGSGAPILNIGDSNVSTGLCALQIGEGRTGNGGSYIDMNTSAGVDYNFRILRNSGVNGSMVMYQQGTGDWEFRTNGTTFMKADSNQSTTLQAPISTDILTLVTNRTDQFGVNFNIRHTSTSPADGDQCGQFNFYANNSTSVDTLFARIQVAGRTVTSGSEDGRMNIGVKVNGTFEEFIKLNDVDNQIDFTGKTVVNASVKSRFVSGTTYTFQLSDSGTLLLANDAGAQTYTVPANSTTNFPIGTRIELTWWGTGSVTIAGAGGVQLTSSSVPSGNQNLAQKYSACTLTQVATDVWLVVGDLA